MKYKHMLKRDIGMSVTYIYTHLKLKIQTISEKIDLVQHAKSKYNKYDIVIGTQFQWHQNCPAL